MIYDLSEEEYEARKAEERTWLERYEKSKVERYEREEREAKENEQKEQLMKIVKITAISVAALMGLFLLIVAWFVHFIFGAVCTFLVAGGTFAILSSDGVYL